MSEGNANHARIASNVLRAIEDALGDSPCNVYNSDLSVRLSETRYAYPDVSVTCFAFRSAFHFLQRGSPVNSDSS